MRHGSLLFSLHIRFHYPHIEVHSTILQPNRGRTAAIPSVIKIHHILCLVNSMACFITSVWSVNGDEAKQPSEFMSDSGGVY